MKLMIKEVFVVVFAATIVKSFDIPLDDLMRGGNSITSKSYMIK
jgi:hypothetical protein